MGEAKNRGDYNERVKGAQSRGASFAGATAEAIDRLNPQGIIVAMDASANGRHIAKKLQEIAAHTLKTSATQIKLWRSLEHFPYLAMFGIAGRPEGTYVQAMSTEEIINTILPLFLARSRGQELISAFIPGVEESLTQELIGVVTKIEASMDPGASEVALLSPADCTIDPTFAADVDKIESWARELNLPGSKENPLFLEAPRYQQLSDGWLRVRATYLDNTTAGCCVPPTHWTVKGAAPGVTLPETRLS